MVSMDKAKTVFAEDKMGLDCTEKKKAISRLGCPRKGPELEMPHTEHQELCARNISQIHKHNMQKNRTDNCRC